MSHTSGENIKNAYPTKVRSPLISICKISLFVLNFKKKGKIIKLLCKKNYEKQLLKKERKN